MVGLHATATLDFLRLLWGEEPLPGFLVTWCKDAAGSGKTRTFRDLPRAAAHLEASAQDCCSYVGCSLQARAPKGGARGKADGACAIAGLWADLDVAGPAHKNAHLPPTKDVAQDLARRAPWPPSLVLDSGNGIQAWWLFPKPWVLTGEEDRRQAGALVARLQERLRAPELNPEGWTVDSTADLARVLRPPGTWNRKLQYRVVRLRDRLAGDLAEDEAAELARELAGIEAYGAQPRPVLVLARDAGERHAPAAWEAVLPFAEPKRLGPVPVAPNGNGRAARHSGRPSVEERAAAYLRTLGPAIQGQGGDPHSTRAAWAVAVEFGLPEPVSRRVLLDWDQGNRPPWQDTEPDGLEAKLRSALAKAPGHPDFGRLANEDRSAPLPGRQDAGASPVPSSPGTVEPDAEDQGRRKAGTQAERLLSLADRGTLFRTLAGEAHVTMEAGGRQETWPVRSKAFSTWLRHEFGRPLGAEPVRQAVDCLEARALHGEESQVREVFVRAAGEDGRLYLDLADAEGRAVEIRPGSWSLTRTPPVAFRRPPMAQALPAPSRQGSWEPLRPLLNLDEEGWVLFVGFLVGALARFNGYPVLIVEGVQGSAKSSLARAARVLLDPSGMPLRRPPDQERDLFISTGNCRLLALDNLTRPPRWLSDALCVIASGGGYACRELHTDREEAVFRACLPVILTGIEGLAQGDDLADRSIVLSLAAIPPEKRMQAEEWERRLLEARPLVLGVLCDAMAGALRCRSAVTPPEGLPRMADFAAFVQAAEEAGALPWERGRFAAALAANRGAAALVGLERDLLASTLAAFVGDVRTWEGTASELLAALDSRLPEGTRRSKSWPGAPHVLTARLPRIEPLLREAGVLLEKRREPGGNRTRVLCLRRMEGEPAAPAEPKSAQAPLWEEGIL